MKVSETKASVNHEVKKNMLKCPNCGNTESFAIDVRATADYNQLTKRFTDVRKIKFPPFHDDGLQKMFSQSTF